MQQFFLSDGLYVACYSVEGELVALPLGQAFNVAYYRTKFDALAVLDALKRGGTFRAFAVHSVSGHKS